MTVYQLKNSALDDMADVNPASRRWYFGSGRGRLAVDATGAPVALVYDEPPALSAPAMTDDEMLAAAGEGGKVVRGMASCWEFCV